MIILFLFCTDGKNTKDIYVLSMTPGTMREQFLAGNIDGFIAWEPYNAEVVVAGRGKYLIQSADVWENHPCCVLAIKNQEKIAAEALIWAHIKATEFINNPQNTEKVLTYAVEFTGKSPEVIAEAIKYITFIEFPDIKEFRYYYSQLEKNQLLIHTLEEIGYSDRESFFSDFLIESFYKNVKWKMENNSSWMPERVSRKIRLGYLTADLHQLAYFIAEKEGYYAQLFSDIKFSQFKNGPVVMDAFFGDLIDAAYLGSAPATLKRINMDMPIHIIAGVNNEGSALVVDPSISKIQNLVGKTLAIPGFGTVQDFILREIAAQAGLRVVTKE